MQTKQTRGAYDGCEMTQPEVAEAMFLSQSTICKIEQSAAAKFREIFEQRGIDILDLLQD